MGKMSGVAQEQVYPKKTTPAEEFCQRKLDNYISWNRWNQYGTYLPILLSHQNRGGSLTPILVWVLRKTEMCKLVAGFCVDQETHGLSSVALLSPTTQSLWAMYGMWFL